MREEIRTALINLAEPEYAEFQRKIVSDTRYPILGVRVPLVRKLAKKLSRGDWMLYLREPDPEYYEEILTAGLALAYAQIPFSEKSETLWGFLPRLDSWALTDSMVPTLRIGQADCAPAWGFARKCLEDDREYTRRFGLVMMLGYFLTPEYIPEVAEQVLHLTDERYYVRMAAAWLLAEMAVQEPSRVLKILEQGKLDPFTHNMTIRKMRESYRVSAANKAAAAQLKRKEKK